MNAYDRPARLNSLLDAIEAGGFKPARLIDEENESYLDVCEDRKALVELVFDLEISWIDFSKADGGDIDKMPIRRIMLIPSNDEDMLSDWSYGEGDPDGFDALLSKWYGFEEN